MDHSISLTLYPQRKHEECGLWAERYVHWLKADGPWGSRWRITYSLRGGLDAKESTSNAEDPSSIPGLGRSLEEGNGTPLQRSFLETPHGQRSLASYSPWGHKELDTAEQLTHKWTPGPWVAAVTPPVHEIWCIDYRRCWQMWVQISCWDRKIHLSLGGLGNLPTF